MSENALPSVLDVAEYLIASCDAKARASDLDDDLMTHLKLQKLVYLAQGASLHYIGVPLFNEPMEAWQHGPVSPSLYQVYKVFGRSPIPVTVPLEQVRARFTETQLDVMDTAVMLFGGYSATSLRQMTHQDEGWRKAFERQSDTISIDDMRRSYPSHVMIGEPVTVEVSAEEAERLVRACGPLEEPEGEDGFNG